MKYKHSLNIKNNVIQQYNQVSRPDVQVVKTLQRKPLMQQKVTVDSISCNRSSSSSRVPRLHPPLHIPTYKADPPPPLRKPKLAQGNPLLL